MTESDSSSFGPLTGIRLVEFAGLGPGPFAAMLLADLGADVIRVDRATGAAGGLPLWSPADFMGRGRRSVVLNLKTPEDLNRAKQLVARADGLIEGYRPGVMEKFGLGPDVCLSLNSRLVYGRMTGWGQTGPLAHAAGHDLNYLALSGALYPMGSSDRPPAPPLNLVADFGGGGLMLAFGMVSAILSARSTGQGQVIDAAMIDGCASFMTLFYGLEKLGMWQFERGRNFLDGSAHFYGCYECQDGGFVSVAAIEPHFYAELLARLELNPDEWPQFPPSEWPRLKEKLAGVFMTKTRDEWCALLEGSDACFAPVLRPDETAQHPHHQARGSFPPIFGASQPGPAPRFSATPGRVRRPPPDGPTAIEDILAEWTR